MGTILDTSLLIDVERGSARIPDDEEVAVAAITAAELLHGVHRADRSRRAAREAFVEGVLSTIRTVPFDLHVARVHARLWAELAATGRTPGAHDLQVAATAVALGWSVAATDRRAFQNIPRLNVLSVGRATERR